MPCAKMLAVVLCLVPLLLVEAKEGATAAAQSTETSASATPAEETGNGSARDDFVKTMLRRKLESAGDTCTCCEYRTSLGPSDSSGSVLLADA